MMKVSEDAPFLIVATFIPTVLQLGVPRPSKFFFPWPRVLHAGFSLGSFIADNSVG